MPKNYRKWVENYLNYAGFDITPEKYAGFSILYGLFLGFAVFFLVFVLNITFYGLSPMIVASFAGLSTFIIFEIFMHSILVVISDRRAKFVDDILPDTLMLISANIRSGLTPDRALLLSARSEFGPLEDQIMKSAKLTFSGESIEDALQIIPKKINSKAVRRSIDLLVEGISRGGNLSKLLEGLANDIRQTKMLKREVHAFVMMYAIFIFFAAGIGAPLLYGISSYLVETMREMGASIRIEQTFSSVKFMSFRGIQISPDFLMLYSLSSLAITSFFGGILIGLIQEGSEKAGLKFIPLLMLLSLSIFFLARILVSRIYTSMI
jgi:pilus assembly protein TadC